MILGLDLGVNLGWVLGAATGPMRHGTFPCKNTSDLGDFLHSSDEFLQAMMPECSAIAVEQPFMGQDYFPCRKLMAMLGHVHYWARFYGKSKNFISEIAVSTGKMTLSGNGAAKAPQMIAAAKERTGLDLDEHEAHALGVWWVYVFGAAEPIRKARSRSSKPVLNPNPKPDGDA